MKNRTVMALLAAMVLITSTALAGTGIIVNSEIPAPPAIGATIEDFTLPDVDGTEHSLNSLKGKNGSVIIWVSVQCPVSNAYNERMEKLAQDYKARGVNVIGINSNVTEDTGAVKSHAAQNKLSFIILKDPGNKIADRFGARLTPEAYFLDANNKLIYHGRIDNSRDPDGVNSNDLRDALDQILAGKPVEKTTATAFGCTIKRA